MNAAAHQLSGSVIAIDIAAPAVIAAFSTGTHPYLNSYASAVEHIFWPFAEYGYGSYGIAMTALCAFLYWLGLLLPDIDIGHSSISKLLHFSLPLAHRGFTHSVWVVTIIALAGVYLFYPLRFLAAGMLSHDISDAFSSAGWVPFYPAGKYYMRGGTVVSLTPSIRVYSSERKGSDLVCAVIFTVVSIAVISFAAYKLLWVPK